MSGIGGWEVILLVMIGLVVLGPKRLPQVANQIGSWIGQARRMTRTMKRQLEDELNFDEDFKPKAPKIAPPPVMSADDPASPDYDLDEAPPVEEHIPGEDDTYSPLHDDGPEDDVDDETEKIA